MIHSVHVAIVREWLAEHRVSEESAYDDMKRMSDDLLLPAGQLATVLRRMDDGAGRLEAVAAAYLSVCREKAKAERNRMNRPSRDGKASAVQINRFMKRRPRSEGE